MKTKNTPPTEAQLRVRNALVAALRVHSDDVTAIELVAIVSHMLGQIVALQDQTKFTPDQVMQVVVSNVEQGNQEVILGLAEGPFAGSA